MAWANQQESRARTAVVVLTWNSAACIERCLQSVRASSAPVVAVVVDNGSTDDTLLIVRAAHPAAVIIETGDNLGYAGGNNVGFTAAKDFEYVFVLNPDAYIDVDTIEQLQRRMDEAPALGGVSPVIYYADSDKVWYAGSDVRWRDGATFHRHQDERAPALDRMVVDTGRLSGCAMMIRQAVLGQVGGFDEAYFLYYEETDLSVRMAEAGWGLEVLPSASCWHAASSSTGGPAGRVYHYYMTRGRLRFLRKHAVGGVRWPAVVHLFAREVVWIARKHGLGAATIVVRMKLKAIRDFRRGVVGRTSI